MLEFPIEQWAKSGEFTLLSAIWELGLGYAEIAPTVMQEAMMQGHSDPAIVYVAGLIHPSKQDDSPALQAAYHALSLKPMNQGVALKTLARYWAERIILGSDEELLAVLESVDDLYGWLEQPGPPFSDFCYFRAMLSIEEPHSPQWASLIEAARSCARCVLDEETSDQQ